MLIRCQMQRSSPGDEGLFSTLKSARKNKKKIISQMRWSLDFKSFACARDDFASRYVP
jgi:hypothetical protein